MLGRNWAINQDGGGNRSGFGGGQGGGFGGGGGMGGGMGAPAAPPGGMPGPRQGGGQMTPGTGAVNQSGPFAAQNRQRQAQESLMRAEQQCQQGIGSACQLAEQLRQRMAMQQGNMQGQMDKAMMSGQGGTMGTMGRGGAGRPSDRSMAQTMLGSMYGGGWG